MFQRLTRPASTFRAGGAGAPAAAGDPCVLQAQRLTVMRGRRTVLREVDFAVAAGETVALLGANGAGKTTLLQCLAGVLRPAAGEVYWCGDLAGRAPDARRRIGFLPHEAGLYGELTVRENLLFAGRMYGLADVFDRVAEMLAAIGMESRARQPVHRLSLGMRRRVAIARAVIHDPPILLLDEPFANLDAASRRWLDGFLAELRRRGRAVCLTSHDLDRCRAAADRVATLDAGRLRAPEGVGEDAAPHGFPLARA